MVVFRGHGGCGKVWKYGRLVEEGCGKVWNGGGSARQLREYGVKVAADWSPEGVYGWIEFRVSGMHGLGMNGQIGMHGLKKGIRENGGWWKIWIRGMNESSRVRGKDAAEIVLWLKMCDGWLRLRGVFRVMDARIEEWRGAMWKCTDWRRRADGMHGLNEFWRIGAAARL